MAIANLHETWITHKLRVSQLQLEISEFQLQKNLAAYSQADVQSLLSSEKHAVRDYFKGIYEGDSELQDKYLDYTKIPEFEEEIDKITAKFQEQLDELTAWETAVDTQITTASAELEEVKAYMASMKEMLSSNVQEDFNFGLNG